jgi:hypothetical protein
MINYKIFNYSITILFILSSIFIFCTDDPLFQNFLTGIIISSIFYFIVDYIPSYLKVKAIKESFLNYYDLWRFELIEYILLVTNNNKSEGINQEDVIKIKKPDDAYSYFNNIIDGSSETNWDLFMNHSNQFNLDEISIKMLELNYEFEFILRSLDFVDKKKLYKLQHFIRAFRDGRYKKEIEFDGYSDKLFFQSLYEIVTGFSKVAGLQGDFIRDNIKKL